MRRLFLFATTLVSGGALTAQAPIQLEMGVVHFDTTTGIGSVEMLMMSSVPIAGFQFDLVFDPEANVLLHSASGGLAGAAGWNVNVGPTSGTVLGFDFPLSEIQPVGVLTELTTAYFQCSNCYCGVPSICIEAPVFSDINANPINVDLGSCSLTVGAVQATVSSYNGSGINLDTMVGSAAVIGEPWTATLTPQPARAAGFWFILMRSGVAAGPILDLGSIFGLPAAGASELLVGGSSIADFSPPPHGGGGTSSSFSVTVPASCSLTSMPWFAQAIVFGDLPGVGGAFDPWFSSAATGIVGTFD